MNRERGSPGRGGQGVSGHPTRATYGEPLSRRARYVHDEPRDTVTRRERCTAEESAASLADHGRPALEWRYYADGSIGQVLGAEVRR